jgi:RimJ/RimL family protein N-acetyltransferase
MNEEARNAARDYRADDVLKDGTRVTVRAVRSTDRNLFLQAFRLLDKESVYTRFFSPHTTVSDAQLDRAVNVDFVQHVALVVTIVTAQGEAIIGSGRYVDTGAREGERFAEVAFVVEEDYQGRGIASRLLAQLVTLARAGGYTRFEADVLPQNESMLAVFKRSGLPLAQERQSGVIHLVLTLQPHHTPRT